MSDSPISHKPVRRPVFDCVAMALFAAVICVLSPFSVPLFGVIPLSFASLGVYIAAGTLGGRRGTVAVLLYVLIGAVGVPVFAGFRGGFAVISGMTGGYIVGYIPCAFLTGLSVRRGRFWLIPGALAGTAVLYTVGTAWYMLLTGSAFATAMTACVIPFIPGDLIKIACATGLCPALRAALARVYRHA